ncbi:hypothetical protein PACTADRAFT_1463 [Pachysolen tannophilus NRRL Y-2460]|uniref:Uncharacterized protein n=1 Tax=Pachysolen tannophilus NRRL Y-2460 TaxID=669874 RepID=A0A1E4TYQ8_PACTA|nr:hypothetical protein PACTADRAFT_1463 [Pachysolen tannophilus NRRL Y-2460]
MRSGKNGRLVVLLAQEGRFIRTNFSSIITLRQQSLNTTSSRQLGSLSNRSKKAKIGASSSRFKTKKDIPSYVKAPEVIRKELKEKYGKIDEKIINGIIEDAQQENSALQQVTKENGEIDINSLRAKSNEDFLRFFEVTMDETERDIQRLIETYQEEEEEVETGMGLIPENDDLKDLKEIAVELDRNTQRNKVSGLQTFISILRELNNEINKSSKDVPIELIARAFELASQIPDERKKKISMYYSANLIYYPGKLRLDPINELFYIETLIQNKKFIKAENLWQSRKYKDVKDQRFWYERGIGFYLSMNDVKKAEKLAFEILQKFNYLHPSEYVNIIRHYSIILNNDTKYKFWLDKLIQDCCSKIGFDTEFKETENLGWLGEDHNAAFDHYNKIEKLRFTDMVELLKIVFQHEKCDDAIRLINLFLKQSPKVLPFLFNILQDPFHKKTLFQLHQRLKEIEKIEFREKIESLVPDKDESKKFLMEQRNLKYLRYLENKKRKKTGDSKNETSMLSRLSSVDCYKLMKDFILRKEVSKAKELFDDMNEMRLNLIQAGYTVQEIDEFEKSFIPPAQCGQFLLMLQVYGRTQDKDTLIAIEALLSQMDELKIRKNTYFLNQLILTYYRKKMFNKALEVINLEVFDKVKKDDNFKITNLLFKNIWMVYRDNYRTYKDDHDRMKNMDQLVSNSLSILIKKKLILPTEDTFLMMMNIALNSKLYTQSIILLDVVSNIYDFQISKKLFIEILKILLQKLDKYLINNKHLNSKMIIIEFLEEMEFFKKNLLIDSNHRVKKTLNSETKNLQFQYELISYFILKYYKLVRGDGVEILDFNSKLISYKRKFNNNVLKFENSEQLIRKGELLKNELLQYYKYR